jgi:hypothetical protein
MKRKLANWLRNLADRLDGNSGSVDLYRYMTRHLPPPKPGNEFGHQCLPGPERRQVIEKMFGVGITTYLDTPPTDI